MGKFIDFMIHWGEEIYQSRREELNRWYEVYGIHEVSKSDYSGVEPATSIESTRQ